jgi:hypothetical protein
MVAGAVWAGAVCVSNSSRKQEKKKKKKKKKKKPQQRHNELLLPQKQYSLVGILKKNPTCLICGRGGKWDEQLLLHHPRTEAEDLALVLLQTNASWVSCWGGLGLAVAVAVVIAARADRGNRTTEQRAEERVRPQSLLVRATVLPLMATAISERLVLARSKSLLRQLKGNEVPGPVGRKGTKANRVHNPAPKKWQLRTPNKVKRAKDTVKRYALFTCKPAPTQQYPRGQTGPFPSPSSFFSLHCNISNPSNHTHGIT